MIGKNLLATKPVSSPKNINLYKVLKFGKLWRISNKIRGNHPTIKPKREKKKALR